MNRFVLDHKNLVYKYWDIILLGITLSVTILVYLSALPKEFTNWDDPIYIVNNPLIQPINWAHLTKILTEPFEANYHPFTLISFAADYFLWKLNPTGYHFHNLTLHLATIIVLFLVLKRIHLDKSTILLSVFLFAVHPTNVECISWASERKSLLAALFFLISFHQYISFRQSNRPLCYLNSLLFFLLSILSKASTIVAPILWLAYDHLYERVPIRKLRLYEQIPFIVIAEIHFFLSIHAANYGHALFSYHSGGILGRILNSGYLLTEYLRILFWPKALNAMIYPQGISVGGEAAVCVVLLGAFGLLNQYNRRLSFWAVWFFLFLLPVLNWVPLPIMMANRYLYLAEIGILILLAEMLRTVFAWAKKLPSEERQPNQWKTFPIVSRLDISFQCKRIILFTTPLIILLWTFFLTYQTLQINRVWRNSFTLWSDVLAKSSHSAIAHFNLGAYYQERGELGRAAAQFESAIQINPHAGPAYAGLAKYYLANQNINAAIDSMRAAVEAAPDSEVFLKNLALLYQAQGRLALARKAYCQAISANPNNAPLYAQLYNIFQHEGEIQAAQEIARLFISRFPSLPDGFFWKGICYKKQNQYENALQAFEECRQLLSPDSAESLEVTNAIENIKKKIASFR